MSSNQGDMEKVQDKVRELEVGQATQAATLAGAQATQRPPTPVHGARCLPAPPAS